MNCLQHHILVFTEENLFHKLQSDFRHNHSTATAIIYPIDTIYQDMDENKITGALFLDLRKAFDTITHSILLSKFELLNPNDQMLNLLNWITIHSSLYNNRYPSRIYFEVPLISDVHK